MSERDRGNLRKISWEQVKNYNQMLFNLIEKSGFKPDFILGIVRGGLAPASLLTYLIPEASFLSLRVIKNGDERKIDASIVNQIDFNGKNVLVVEDMLETGRSAWEARDFLKMKGANVKVACYFASQKSEIDPDFVLEKGVVDKIVFPWENLGK